MTSTSRLVLLAWPSMVVMGLVTTRQFRFLTRPSASTYAKVIAAPLDEQHLPSSSRCHCAGEHVKQHSASSSSRTGPADHHHGTSLAPSTSEVSVAAILASARARRLRQRRRMWLLKRESGRRLKVARRSAMIWACAIKFAYQWVRIGRFRGPELVEARRELARDFREALLMLGPTFIKFGQLLSTRVDVVPPEVIAELVSLQNEVPGFAPERALEIVRQELKGEFPFSSFETKPLAAASLAQVHRATLATGEQVVVKVQRDGLREQFKVDCANIKFLARLADWFDPQEEGVSANWKGIAESSERVLYREIDFRVERESCDKFGANFAATPWVKIPKTYPAYSTRRVLVMEYVEGRKINNPPQGCDRQTLAERLTTSYLEQLCRHGFFHCDPHPGNVACDNGYPGGRIIYYDFGMMESIEPAIKKGFVDLVYALYKNEPALAVDALEIMGVLRPQLDRFSIERIARNYVNTFANTIATDAPWENQLDASEAKERRRERRAKLGADLFATQADRPFVFPPKFTFVFRAISTIDGIGKSLDPKNFDLTRLASPYLRELADLRDGSAIKTALLEIAERVGLRPRDIAQVVTQPRAVASMRTSLQRLERGELKLRVRTTECESTVERIETRQKLVSFALATCVLFNTATAPALVAELPVFLIRKAALIASIFCAYKAAKAYLELDKLERRKTRFFNLELQDDAKMY